MDVLLDRAKMLQEIRAFFAKRNVLEVETPLLGHYGVTEPFTENLVVPWKKHSLFLQTSPEYAMKRLLVAGSGPIYQICKAFRDDEAGVHHNPEFTMLEWYRPGFDLQDLMTEVADLVSHVLQIKSIVTYTYAQLFECYLNLHLDSVSDQTLITKAHEIAGADLGLARDEALDLLLTHCIEPNLPQQHLVFVHSFPPSKAALAKLKPCALSGKPVAQRFELYVNGIELANAYDELLDVQEQRERFIKDNLKRKALGLTQREFDERLLSALQVGLPECSGIAVGLDRLLMLRQKVSAISKVMSFDYDNS